MDFGNKRSMILPVVSTIDFLQKSCLCDNRQMKYETVQALKDEEFERSTGVQRSTFDEMLKVVEAGLGDFGRPPKLGGADQLLLTLMYWREYRTGFYIGLSYGESESTVCRTKQKVEDVLIKSEQFHLPGKKMLQSSDR
jgi:hypothetical protein